MKKNELYSFVWANLPLYRSAYNFCCYHFDKCKWSFFSLLLSLKKKLSRYFCLCLDEIFLLYLLSSHNGVQLWNGHAYWYCLLWKKNMKPLTRQLHIFVLLSLEYSPHATRTFHPNIMRIVIAIQNCQYMLKIDDIV